MAFGFQGPIGDGSTIGVGDHGMVDYALSRTYRILSADRNEKIAACKICGTTLPRGTGFKVLISGLVFTTPKNCYICLACLQPVKRANEAFPLFDPAPSWWKVLERNASFFPEDPEETPSKPSAQELEDLIRTRESAVTKRRPGRPRRKAS